MAKWKFDFVMNSGNKITGLYEGVEETFDDILDGITTMGSNHYYKMYSYYGFGKELLLVRKSEVAAVSVSRYNEGV